MRDGPALAVPAFAGSIGTATSVAAQQDPRRRDEDSKHRIQTEAGSGRPAKVAVLIASPASVSIFQLQSSPLDVIASRICRSLRHHSRLTTISGVARNELSKTV